MDTTQSRRPFLFSLPIACVLTAVVLVAGGVPLATGVRYARRAAIRSADL